MTARIGTKRRAIQRLREIAADPTGAVRYVNFVTGDRCSVDSALFYIAREIRLLRGVKKKSKKSERTA